MKKLLLIFALVLCGVAHADVTSGPQCVATPQVAAGGGAASDPCAAPATDQRQVNIKAFWDKYSIYPPMIWDAMKAFGVDADGLEDATDYKVDITQWLRFNAAPDGLGGVKQWPTEDIDQYLKYANPSKLADRWARTHAQDQLDLAARRKALYSYYNMPVPDGVAPWEHAAPAPVTYPSITCTGVVCVDTGP